MSEWTEGAREFLARATHNPYIMAALAEIERQTKRADDAEAERDRQRGAAEKYYAEAERLRAEVDACDGHGYLRDQLTAAEAQVARLWEALERIATNAGSHTIAKNDPGRAYSGWGFVWDVARAALRAEEIPTHCVDGVPLEEPCEKCRDPKLRAEESKP